MIDAVQTRLEIDVTELKNYLRIEHIEDDNLLTDFIDMAKEQIDAYLQNEFTEIDENGVEVARAIPFSINLAVFKMVAAWYEHRTDGISSENVSGHNVQLGEMPWNAIKILAPFKKLVGT